MSAAEGGDIFPRLVTALRAVRLPAALHAEEMPAPTRIARAAWAMSGWVGAERPVGVERGTGGDGTPPDEPLAADGRFVLLHGLRATDTIRAPGADWRIVVLVRAVVDVAMAEDPLVTAVAWHVLSEMLEAAGARTTGATATVTRSISEAFGRHGDRDPEQTVELRASWTPLWGPRPIRAAPSHLWAWARLLGSAGGLPEVSDMPHPVPVPRPSGSRRDA